MLKLGTINDLAEYLKSLRFERFGMCMFSPNVMAPAANRALNLAFGDAGDNLSIPLSNDLSGAQYWGGNYSAAPIDYVVRGLTALASIPGLVVLVTSPGVGTEFGTAFVLLEHGRFSAVESVAVTFHSFAHDYLGLDQGGFESRPIPGFYDRGITLQIQVLFGSENSRILLRTPWEAIFQELMLRPSRLFDFRSNPREFEEFIAETYRLDGYEVKLTPRSNDGGIDVVAAKNGFGAIKILDQAKAYSENRKVSANDVRAAFGVLSASSDASKVIVTSTSEFAPGVYKEFERFMPTRLEVRSGQRLIEWLKHVEYNLRA